MSHTNRPHRLASFFALFCAALLLASASVVRADDNDNDWKILGDAKIERKSGTTQIDFGADQGLVKRIKFEVRGADVQFKKVTVSFENGDPEDIDVRDTVKRGGKTRAIDLKGGNRAIKRVVIAFKVDKDTDRDARIILLGSK